MSNKNISDSFARALEGLSYVLWTQKHVRTQVFMVMLVLLLSYFAKLQAMEVLLVLSAIAVVLIAEFFNSAIEVVVNMITESYHPLAKVAKDVSAAGVLIAVLYAVAVGGGIFLNRDRVAILLGGLKSVDILAQPHPAAFVAVGIVVISILVALTKVRAGRGSILRGGAVSGHTAVAFLLFAAIFIYSKYNPLISILALCLAILVAQSRVEGKIHTVAEVLWGAMVALVLMALLILFWSPS